MRVRRNVNILFERREPREDKNRAFGLSGCCDGGSGLAAEGPVPTGMPHLDHVFVIMMENHGYSQIVNNPNLPYINELANLANTATNYFAIAHPSLTNYLEVVGGSNFGVHSDNYPDWHNFYCTTNLASGDRLHRQSFIAQSFAPSAARGRMPRRPRSIRPMRPAALPA